MYTYLEVTIHVISLDILSAFLTYNHRRFAIGVLKRFQFGRQEL
jgi:hypothetical protein